MNSSTPPPPTTNRGVEKQVSLSIHWIECTFKKGVEVKYHPDLSDTKTECKPFNAYNVGVRYPDGRIELHHSARKEMGVHVVLSGAALDTFPIEPIEYLKHLISSGATITRIDLAVDALNMKLSPEVATERLKNGKCKTKATKSPVWNDPRVSGYTQYIGTKSSEIYVRIYDKGAEMGINTDWCRTEIVYRGKRAQGAAYAVLDNTDFRSLVRGFVDFDGWKEWTEVMSMPPIKIKSVSVETNTQKWLLQVAAASLAREIHLAGDDEFYFRFIDCVRVKLEELRLTYDLTTMQVIDVDAEKM